jgi:hypothetical protein
MQTITDGVLALASGTSSKTGQILPISPAGTGAR